MNRVVEYRRTKEDGGHGTVAIVARGFFGVRWAGEGRGDVECDAIARWGRSWGGVGRRRKGRVSFVDVLAVVRLHPISLSVISLSSMYVSNAY